MSENFSLLSIFPHGEDQDVEQEAQADQVKVHEEAFVFQKFVISVLLE